ncbi:hypothetical protein HGA91_02375 [candidate division WWE3 bacterium]|nr:hypothetical protein [candidate division WWE3 bacterium]
MFSYIETLHQVRIYAPGKPGGWTQSQSSDRNNMVFPNKSKVSSKIERACLSTLAAGQNDDQCAVAHDLN